jgi:hypothetical protein
MPSYSQPFFLDGTTLSDSTSIFENSGLTVVAPDGYYSDGVIIRQQVGGLLLPQFTCPACGFPCGQNLANSGDEGVYYMEVDTGTLPTAVGAIIVRFASGQIPDSIRVEYDGVVYNELSSPFYGYLAAPPGLDTWIGQQSFDCGIVTGSPHTVPRYEWDGTAFVLTGSNDTVTVTAPQLQLTPTSPDNAPTGGNLWSVMVIPKLDPLPSLMTLTISAVCGTTSFLFDISCPGLIKSINASFKFDTIDSLYCAAALTNKLYPVRVNGVSPYLGLYDWVFIDEYGQTKAADGYYKTNNLTGGNNTIKVENGVIIEISTQCAI